MTFDTAQRSTKRIRENISSFNKEEDDDDWYNTPIGFFNQKNTIIPEMQRNDWVNKHYDVENYQSSVLSSPPIDYMLPATPSTIPIDIPYSTNTSEQLDTTSIDNTTPFSSLHWQDDYFSHTEPRSSISTVTTTALSPSTSQPLDTLIDLPSLNPRVADALSKVQLSYTDKGINLEAKVSNATDLRSLIDAFSHLCCTDMNDDSNTHNRQSQIDKTILYRNKSNQTKPVNFFASTSDLGQISNPHSSLHSDDSLREIADACIDTFFTCWVRFKPIIKKCEFMAWYKSQERPMDTLIINAICSYVFRHMIIHHSRPGLSYFIKDQAKLKEQEEYFYSRARECLDQSFDTPDRYTVIALLFMSLRAEPSKRHHYVGIASSSLHELGIYPRMANEDVDSYEKELDTRLWWYVWAVDFSLWTAGAPKNTPQPRVPGEVDLPQVFEQDIDETEISVITFAQCLTIWRIQADIVAALYDNDHSELTTEQLTEYDKRLLDFHHALPKYLQFDSGFEYGCADLFMACLRVNIEYNATYIILHKLFIPEMHDPRPSQASLRSLNVCLSTALTQLSAIKTCTMVDVGRCAFDRDELWRAAEVVSVAMDIYHTCASPDDQAKIIQGIRVEDFSQGLLKSFDILRHTREYQFECRDWLQVADWMQVDIRRHQLNTPYQRKMKDDKTAIKKPDFFLAHLKPHLTVAPPQQPPSNKLSKQPKQPRKSISFQNQFSVSSTTSTSSQPSRKSSFSASPPFVQFNNYVPPEPKSPKQQAQFINSNGGKNQARFRYFNPRKMNKFLFIDEHPMM
ncbi:hypothetical protein G6F46_000408 [Rhizopus delemar]|nr:hypothetical protein G6F55_000854 [Rhizopus delemar]KAG1553234.1 hypothetical protein G6F51_000725 [Rhizopus arrhizus]KAG1505734.1 hypothetical protein G6F54_000102 [Rhizopus delemar]KAG1517495.1 hypothetical protein G6F53_001336 [Rhizopus delemar]KAG1528593.1 hypothetical protein G6F52_000514 [Rhizopus delemar]